MSLTESVMRILEQQALAQSFTRVRTLWLEIGELSHVSPEAMEFCFTAIAPNFPVAAGARLEIVRIPGRAWCADCAETVAVAQHYDPCPKCGSDRLTVSGGEDMRVKELEVE